MPPMSAVFSFLSWFGFILLPRFFHIFLKSMFILEIYIYPPFSIFIHSSQVNWHCNPGWFSFQIINGTVLWFMHFLRLFSEKTSIFSIYGFYVVGLMNWWKSICLKHNGVKSTILDLTFDLSFYEKRISCLFSP